jgi:hypothetical protein
MVPIAERIGKNIDTYHRDPHPRDHHGLWLKFYDNGSSVNEIVKRFLPELFTVILTFDTRTLYDHFYKNNNVLIYRIDSKMV